MQAELKENFFVRNALAAPQGCAGARQGSSGFAVNFLFVNRGVREGVRQRLEEIHIVPNYTAREERKSGLSRAQSGQR